MKTVESKLTGKEVSLGRTSIQRGVSVPRQQEVADTEDLEDPDDLHKTKEELKKPANYDFMINIQTRAEEMTIGLKGILGRRPTKNELWYALRSARHAVPSSDVSDAHPKNQTLARIDTYVKGYRRTHAQELQEYSHLSKYSSRIRVKEKDSSSSNIPPSDTTTPRKEPVASTAKELRKKTVPEQHPSLSEQPAIEKKALLINPPAPTVSATTTTPPERIVPQHKKREVTLMADAMEAIQDKRRAQSHDNNRLRAAFGLSSYDITPKDQHQINEKLHQVTPPFSEREILIAQLRTGVLDGQFHSFEEIGKRIGNLSRVRAWQIETRILTRLGFLQKPSEKPAPTKSPLESPVKKEAFRPPAKRPEFKHDNLYEILGPWTNALDPKQRRQLNREIRKTYSSTLTPRETQIMKDIDRLKDDASAISQIAQQRKLSEWYVRKLKWRAIVKMHRALIRNGDVFKFIHKYNRSSEAT